MQRRQVLKLSILTALQASFPNVLARALELPAHAATRSIRDVNHIVFLMQENRSFDHYYGTLRGVRGYGDPRAARLPNGRSVFAQPGPAGEVLPFHPKAPELGLQFLQDLAHDWTTTQHARNGGRYDRWISAKGTTTMAHLTRADIPYHYALADAFTICDAYHCSLLGPTDPNRYYMWTGCVGNNGNGGGPVVDNAEAGYGWSTFPERLEDAGISWRVYQDIGSGLDSANAWGDGKDPYVGNYGDNALLYFDRYRNALPGTSLHAKACSGTNVARQGTLFDHLRADVAGGTLPSVSWICAPEAYSEHPNWPANYGAWYISKVLDILTSNPEVWSQTALFLMFDENDGFFDHMVPPAPPVTREHGLSMVPTEGEFFPGSDDLPPGPYGMGVRVPMLVISPWSRGGWVNSELFDHTSLIRFVETRFADEHPEIVESNITPWRRAIAGDLTSAFDFADPNGTRVQLPVTRAYEPSDRQRHPSYKPHPPAVQKLPVQETGMRPARPLPYQLDASGFFDEQKKMLQLKFRNEGSAAAVFQLRPSMQDGIVRTYTVIPSRELTDTYAGDAERELRYDIRIYGPNGFYRRLTSASRGHQEPGLDASASYDPATLRLILQLKNNDSQPLSLMLEDKYAMKHDTVQLHAGEQRQHPYDLSATHGWYDIVVMTPGNSTFQRHFAGHVENGRPSFSDPALGNQHNNPEVEA